MTFPHAGRAMPDLPPKSVICGDRIAAKHVDMWSQLTWYGRQVSAKLPRKEKAGTGIFPQVWTACNASGFYVDYIVSCLLLNPEFSSAPVTKDFIFN